MSTLASFWGSTSGIRGLVLDKIWRARLSGKLMRWWLGESVSQLANQDLKPLQTIQDKYSAQLKYFDQSQPRLRNQLAETYALQRDANYTLRSRRWLYARAAQTRLDAAYEEYRIYAWDNATEKITAKLPNKSLEVVRRVPYFEAMGVPAA